MNRPICFGELDGLGLLWMGAYPAEFFELVNYLFHSWYLDWGDVVFSKVQPGVVDDLLVIDVGLYPH